MKSELEKQKLLNVITDNVFNIIMDGRTDKRTCRGRFQSAQYEKYLKVFEKCTPKEMLFEFAVL